LNQIVWLILFLVLLVVELSTISLVSIWFAIASLVSFITSYFTSVLWIQLLVFILVSTLSLIFTKKIVKKVTSKEVIKTNLDRVVDSIGVVTEDIKKLSNETKTLGEVKVDGKTWSAISKEEIPKGNLVKVLAIDGVKLIVESIKEEK